MKFDHGMLSLPDNFLINPESLNEQVLIELYKKCKTEVKCQFLSSILKVGKSLEGLFLPYNVNIFKDEVQLVMSVVSQVLVLDSDKHVSEVILGFVLSIGSIDLESNLVRCFNFDEFLAEAIHTQLVGFQHTWKKLLCIYLKLTDVSGVGTHKIGLLFCENLFE